jgi:hypothetical protein
MEQILYIVLGALLALLGGFLTQRYQNHILKKREDRELLLRALDVLIDLEAILDALPAAREDVKKPCKEIFASARRIQTKSYYGLAEKLIEFALKDVKHTEEELNKLIDEIRAEISKPFDIFHRKEKKFFEKVAEELREMREKEESEKKMGE